MVNYNKVLTLSEESTRAYNAMTRSYEIVTDFPVKPVKCKLCGGFMKKMVKRETDGWWKKRLIGDSQFYVCKRETKTHLLEEVVEIIKPKGIFRSKFFVKLLKKFYE